MLAPTNLKTVTINGVLYVNQGGKLVPVTNPKPAAESQPKPNSTQG